jgi:hypothetical protein
MAGILVLLAVSLAPAAQGATGLEPGVHADPGSPAAKEYALPLNQARGTNNKASAGGGSTSVGAFGAGIKPPGAGGSSHRGSRGAHATGDRAALPAAVSAASSRAGSGGGSSSILALLVGGVAVLLLGGFVGTVLRRSHHPTASA